MPVVSVIGWLLEPGTPVLVKIVLVIGIIVAVTAWWTRDYWQDLHRPDEVETDRRRARPPF